MLIVTRKTQQKIKIGEDVVITITSIKGKSVQVGVEAPRDVPVLRGELEQREVEGAK